jgi:hypothetical protein
LDEEYLIVSSIGEGKMSRVYYAEHLTLLQPVPLKVLKPAFSRSTFVRDQLRKEARFLARLHSPHTVRVHDASCQNSDFAYIAMDYVPGGNLFDYLSRKLPISVPVAIEIVLQVWENPLRLDEENPEVTSILAGIVARCIRVPPEDRFASAAELMVAPPRLSTSTSREGSRLAWVDPVRISAHTALSTAPLSTGPLEGTPAKVLRASKEARLGAVPHSTEVEETSDAASISSKVSGQAASPDHALEMESIEKPAKDDKVEVPQDANDARTRTESGSTSSREPDLKTSEFPEHPVRGAAPVALE